MLKKLRQILVESFVGAIALGWMLAEIVAHLVNVFAAPVASWIGRTEYRDVLRTNSYPTAGFLLQDALPELIRFIVLLLVWYVLVRWLYFKPVTNADAEIHPDPEPAA
jgi:hypothetical protein